MLVATFNVNSIRQRIDIVRNWLLERQPDVACFQEIKCQNSDFPHEAFDDLGYNIAVHGQKTFNGVAIFSKTQLDDVIIQPIKAHEQDEQARSIEAIVKFGSSVLRVLNIYAPNGNPLGTEKFPYKLAWTHDLVRHVKANLAHEEPYIILGDYNIIPEDIDCDDPKAWTKDALFQPESRSLYRELQGLGLTDAVRATRPEAGVYTFWDYKSQAWPRDEGIRIDHALLSPQAADQLVETGIDKHLRGLERPSDHVPVWVRLASV